MVSEAVRKLIELALTEDVGAGDITTNVLIAADKSGSAEIVAKQDLIVCGQAVAAEVFRALDSSMTYRAVVADSAKVTNGTVIATLKGSLRGLLTGERTALNFLQRLCGIATATAEIVLLVSRFGTKILDTRKTTPGWRELEKYAVKTGGGTNHRAGLYDAVLIKNNHIDACDGKIAVLVHIAREKNKPGTFIEVEVRNQNELHAALDAHPNGILLDNMSPTEIRESIKLIRERQKKPIICEASGGITAANIVSYAETGIDAISLGALTHSAQAVDISLRCHL